MFKVHEDEPLRKRQKLSVEADQVLVCHNPGLAQPSVFPQLALIPIVDVVEHSRWPPESETDRPFCLRSPNG